MAGSLLRSFVSGTRQMLSAQLFVSVGAVALAGWTLGVTNELIRERDRLRERVIQLEESMGTSGIVVPATPAVVDEPAPAPDATAYPGEVGLTQTPTGEIVQTQTPEDAKPPELAPGQTVAPPAEQAPPQAEAAAPDLGRFIGELFAPPPPMRIIVLHVRAQEESALAQRIARELQQSGQIRVLVDVMPPRDPRESGYAYFDGRQSRASAALVSQFNDVARRQEIAAWSAQLRGVALPAQGEYTADRLDIVLPPLPPPASLERLNRRDLVRPPN